MKRWGSVVAVALLVSAAAPASAMNWSLGANLGLSIVSPDSKYDVEDRTIFGWPSAPDFAFDSPLAGIRVGFTGEQPAHEIYVDSGVSYASVKDAGSQRSVVITANYQYNFGTGSVAPYLTAGAGFVLGGLKIESSDPTVAVDVSGTGAIFGGGVGLRHKMGNGHGTMRGEVRFDRTTEGKDGDIPVIFESNVFGIKLGFDLWD